MATEPRKPRARSRRKAASSQDAAPALPACASDSVAVLEQDGGACNPTPEHRNPVSSAEAMAVELAAMSAVDVAGDDDSHETREERIRSVHELLRLPDGEVELLLFRIGAESFAFDLAAAEEAVELVSVHAVPDMPDAMLGVFDLRGRLVPVYSPAAVLRAQAGDAGVLLLMRAGDRRVGIVVDDVQDVVVLGRAMLRPPPSIEGDGLVLGVAFFDDELVTILDAHALVATCALPSTAEVA
jgi:purine-binding chemotaxis protein CheW